jgi:hypothetical protein
MELALSHVPRIQKKGKKEKDRTIVVSSSMDAAAMGSLRLWMWEAYPAMAKIGLPGFESP